MNLTTRTATILTATLMSAGLLISPAHADEPVPPAPSDPCADVVELYELRMDALQERYGVLFRQARTTEVRLDELSDEYTELSGALVAATDALGDERSRADHWAGKSERQAATIARLRAKIRR